MREFWFLWLGALSPEPLRRTGRCLPTGGNHVLALGEVLKEHFGIRRAMLPTRSAPPRLPRDPRADPRPRRRRRPASAGGARPPARRVERAPRRSPSERPVVILIEDVHWAEQPLLDLIERLGRDVRGPMLLLTTARPDFMDLRSAWRAASTPRRSCSSRYPPGPRESLVDSLLAGELPPRIRKSSSNGRKEIPSSSRRSSAA